MYLLISGGLMNKKLLSLFFLALFNLSTVNADVPIFHNEPEIKDRLTTYENDGWNLSGPLVYDLISSWSGSGSGSLMYPGKIEKVTQYLVKENLTTSVSAIFQSGPVSIGGTWRYSFKALTRTPSDGQILISLITNGYLNSTENEPIYEWKNTDQYRSFKLKAKAQFSCVL